MKRMLWGSHFAGQYMQTRTRTTITECIASVSVRPGAGETSHCRTYSQCPRFALQGIAKIWMADCDHAANPLV